MQGFCRRPPIWCPGQPHSRRAGCTPVHITWNTAAAHPERGPEAALGSADKLASFVMQDGRPRQGPERRMGRSLSRRARFVCHAGRTPAARAGLARGARRRRAARGVARRSRRSWRRPRTAGRSCSARPPGARLRTASQARRRRVHGGRRPRPAPQPPHPKPCTPPLAHAGLARRVKWAGSVPVLAEGPQARAACAEGLCTGGSVRPWGAVGRA